MILFYSLILKTSLAMTVVASYPGSWWARPLRAWVRGYDCRCCLHLGFPLDDPSGNASGNASLVPWDTHNTIARFHADSSPGFE